MTVQLLYQYIYINENMSFLYLVIFFIFKKKYCRRAGIELFLQYSWISSKQLANNINSYLILFMGDKQFLISEHDLYFYDLSLKFPFCIFFQMYWGCDANKLYRCVIKKVCFGLVELYINDYEQVGFLMQCPKGIQQKPTDNSLEKHKLQMVLVSRIFRKDLIVIKSETRLVLSYA